MTIQQLKYIVALDDHRHYVKAAEHCFVSQPNLTMQVQKLEDEIGVQIFNRDKKPLQPTEIGSEVIIRARQILLECRQLKDLVKMEKESMEGEFSLGIIPTLAPYLLPLFLPDFLKHNPKLRLVIKEMQTGQIVSQLENGMIDLGLLVTPINESSIKEIPIFYEPFLLYLPKNHRFLKEKLLMADDLDPSEILVLDEGHCFRDQALAICKNARHGSAVGFEYQSGSIEALKRLVKHGVGYTLVPELSVISELKSKHIRRFTSPEPVREVSVVVHNNFIKHKLIDYVVDSIKAKVPSRFLTKQMVVPFGPL